MKKIFLKDIQGEGSWKITEDTKYENVVITDVFFDNNENIPINVYLKDGDSYEYIRGMVANRKVMPTFVVKGPRDLKSVANALKNLEKSKPNEVDKDILKKVKSTFTKLSVDNEFNYREVADKIRELSSIKDCKEPIVYTENTVIDEKFLVPFLISQTLECLEKYSYIHPKIKLLINQIDKPIGIEFETE